MWSHLIHAVQQTLLLLSSTRWGQSLCSNWNWDKVWKISSSSRPEWDTTGLEVANLMQTAATTLGTN